MDAQTRSMLALILRYLVTTIQAILRNDHKMARDELNSAIKLLNRFEDQSLE